MSGSRRSSMIARVGGLTALALAGCAATGVTLRSNHYRVHVPPGWQVVEAGGDSGIPTLLRAPAEGGDARSVEIRIYAWLAHGPIADPAGDALERLHAAGVLDLPTATADDEQPCAERAATFIVFGKPARAIHVRNSAGQRIVVTAGHAYGSLVGVVGIAPAGQSCADVETMEAALKRLLGTMAASGDTSRPEPYPTIGSGPAQPIPLPPADPGPLTP